MSTPDILSEVDHPKSIADEVDVNREGKAGHSEGAHNQKRHAGGREVVSGFGHLDIEGDKLESGRFQPNVSSRINWPENTRTGPSHPISASRRHRESKSGNRDTQRTGFHWFGFGGAGGRARLPHKHIHSEAHAVARAEAASWAQMCPLMAATLGPLAVLLGIPSLTQRWHGLALDPPFLPNGFANYETLPDPPINLALAGVALFCEVMGNALLVLRFSNFHTKITTWLSYGFWIAKIVLGVSNYIQFGVAHPQTDGIIYLQGFWVGL